MNQCGQLQVRRDQRHESLNSDHLVTLVYIFHPTDESNDVLATKKELRTHLPYGHIKDGKCYPPSLTL